ncbi:hypothetical protein IAR50_005440 [Cryptococcus sp. DSM 104548]
MADLTSAFHAVPPVTRTLLVALAAVTAQVTSPLSLALSAHSHIGLVCLGWRPLLLLLCSGGQSGAASKCVFIHNDSTIKVWADVHHPYPQRYGVHLRASFTASIEGRGFPLLYDFFLIYRNSSAMETVTYRSDTAEYAWLHIMLSVFILLFNIPIGLVFLFRPLLHAQTYVWCRVNPTVRVSIFGLFTLPTSLYPPTLILLDLLTGGPAKAMGGLIGLLAGHLWWFLSTYLPIHAPSHLRRANPLATPLIFKRQFLASHPAHQTATNNGLNHSQTTGHSTARSDAAQAARHRWGGGQRLGGSAL